MQNRYYGTYLYLASGSAANSYVSFYSSSGSYGTNWSFAQATAAKKLFLFDSDSGNMLNIGGPITIDINSSINLVCAPFGIYTNTFTVSPSSLYGYNSSTCTITGIQCGETNISITHQSGVPAELYTLRVILPLSGSELPYQPELWNNDTDCWLNTNCYAYALNRQTNDPSVIGAIGIGAQPGEFSNSTIAIEIHH